MSLFAPKYRYLTLDESDRQIESGSTILVYGIVLTNSDPTAVSVEMQDADGIEIHTFRLDATSSFEFDIPFVAYNGLQFASGAATEEITVFYGLSR